ncbi:hypothetical protein N2152v2_003962 [Parachlorella kessleri]
MAASKVALVTGGAKGIGLACALALGRAGHKVLVADLDKEGLAAAKQKLEDEGVTVSTTVCDVGDKASIDAAVKQAVEQFGGLDVAVANAGIVKTADFLDVTEEDWDAVLRVNLKGVFLTGQAAARQMVEQNKQTPGRGGAIVNMSSVNGIMAIPTIAPYNASKGAINNLTSLASEDASYMTGQIVYVDGG